MTKKRGVMNYYHFSTMDGNSGRGFTARTDDEAYEIAKEKLNTREVKLTSCESIEEMHAREDKQEHISDEQKHDIANKIRTGDLVGLQGGSLNNFTLGSYLHCMDGVRVNGITKQGFWIGKKGEFLLCRAAVDGNYIRLNTGAVDVMDENKSQCNRFNASTNIAKAFIYTNYDHEKKLMIAYSYPCFSKINFNDFFSVVCEFIDEDVNNQKIFRNNKS